MPCASCSQTKRANVSVYFTGLPSLSPGKIHTSSVRERLFSMLPHLELRTFYIVSASGAWALGVFFNFSLLFCCSLITFDVTSEYFPCYCSLLYCLYFLSCSSFNPDNRSLYLKSFEFYTASLSSL